MARRAAVSVGDYINATEVYLRLALEAQTQCRATIQTLFEIKNPQPVAFVRQENIANRPQQVNNGGTSGEATLPRGNSSGLVEPTIGAGSWLTAGHRNGGSGRRH